MRINFLTIYTVGVFLTFFLTKELGSVDWGLVIGWPIFVPIVFFNYLFEFLIFLLS